MIYLELFLVFFGVGLFTIGGGYAMVPLLKTEILSRGWMSEALFIDFISISESTPGPLAINMATFIGTEMGGILGALVATTAMVLPSLFIITLIAALFTKIVKHPVTQSILTGVKPVIIALIATTLLFLLRSLLFPIAGNYALATMDLRHLILLIDLGTVYFGIRYFKKKAPNPMVLIGLSAALGILIFAF
jgi:chromate transporter